MWRCPALTPPARAAAPGFFPLDEELALLPGSLCPQAAAALVRLGTDFAFAPAAALLADLLGIQVSESTARRHTETCGALLVAAQTAAAPALAPPADPGPDHAIRLQASVDGAMIALVGGTWAEVKTVVIGEVTQRPDETGHLQPHATHLSYFSRLACAEEFRRLAVVETARRGLRAAPAVAGVMDGADWLQSWLDYHRPDAVRILDLPHALDHLHELAQAIWGDAAQAQAWWRAQKKCLLEQGAAPVLAAVAPLAAQAVDPEGFATHAGYLAAREAQMAYPAFRAAGWPIGSGIVESGNKLVVEQRLKGPGMRWQPGHANGLLALRNGECSGRWGETWTTVLEERRAAARQRRTAQRARRQARRAPETGAAGSSRVSTPPAVPDEAVNAQVVAHVAAILAQPRSTAAPATASAAGSRQAPQGPLRPAPNHPWRRSPIGKACAEPPRPFRDAKL
jgi:hypothetical protein